MVLQHNGVKIKFDEKSAKFIATVAGKKYTAPSFEAMKKQLDKLETFKPFPIIRLDRWSGKIQTASVVCLGSVSRGYYRGQPVFKMANGQEEHTVLDDTPGDRKALAAIAGLKARHEAIEAAHKEEQNKAEAALPWRRAKDEAK